LISSFGWGEDKYIRPTREVHAVKFEYQIALISYAIYWKIRQMSEAYLKDQNPPGFVF